MKILFGRLVVLVAIVLVGIVIGSLWNIPNTKAQVNYYDTGIISVTDGVVTIINQNFWLRRLHCVNITGGAATLTVEDGNGVDYFTAVSVAANSVLVGNWGEVGIKMSNGLKWTSGTNAAINCQAEGRVN